MTLKIPVRCFKNGWKEKRKEVDHFQNKALQKLFFIFSKGECYG